MNLISQKIHSLNKQYEINPLNSSSKKFYEYNIIYGYKTNNIIKTYTPKLSQRAPTSKNKTYLNNKNNIQVFTEEEIIELFSQKCKDLGVPIKDELMNRFLLYIKEKCINRIIDLTDCSLGINSMYALSDILSKNIDICSRIILTKNNFGDQGIEILIENIKNNSNIVELNLCSNNIGTKGGIIIFNYLLNQNSVITLDLSSKEGIYRNRICAEGVKLIEKVLKKNYFLEKLDLSSNSIKNEGLKYLVNGLISNFSLQTLLISNNEITEKGIIYMKSKLNLCKLKYLDISCNPISNNGLILLSKCLSGNQLNEITYLNVAECSFNFEAFKAFIKNIAKNHKLQTLILNKNNLFSNKWDILEDAFNGLALKNLYLGSCGIGPVLKNVSQAFIRNATIKYLDLSHNKINDKEFEYFQEYPIENLTLEEIDFSNNFISDKSALIFFRNLLHNNNFQKLNFFDNQLQNESANEILEVLKQNHNIINININCNRIGIKMMKEIKTKILNNKLIEKEKYLPKLKDELKGLEFNPLEINFLKDKIIRSDKEREILAKKFLDEMKELSLKKQKNLDELKIVENNFLDIQNEIKLCEKNLRNLNEENIQENDNFNKNLKIIKDKIILIQKEIRDIKYKQDRYKISHEDDIQLLKDTYDKTFKEEKDIKDSIIAKNKELENDIKRYKKKLSYLDKLKNYKLLSEKSQKENLKRSSSKIIRKKSTKIIKENLSIEIKKKKENNDDKIKESNFSKKRSQSIIQIKSKKES